MASNPIDGNAIELGVRFRSQVNGYITGVRFYKGAENTGPHVGHLWTNTAASCWPQATFTNETATGWQRVTFASPVPITANTTYVASYHTASGHYAVDRPYFQPAGTANPPLRALSDGQDGPNGVYLYTAAPGEHSRPRPSTRRTIGSMWNSSRRWRIRLRLRPMTSTASLRTPP